MNRTGRSRNTGAPAVLLCLLVGAAPAVADVQVLGAFGDRQPMTRWLAPVIHRRPVLRPPGNAQTALGVTRIENLLPIPTARLTPGPLVQTTHRLRLEQPVFLIGSDRRSQAWLTQYRDRLQGMHAVGLLVQADTVADLEAIAEIGQGLSIVPVSAGDLVRTLGLVHYPVCITATQVWQ